MYNKSEIVLYFSLTWSNFVKHLEANPSKSGHKFKHTTHVTNQFEHTNQINPAGIYLLKVNNGSTRTRLEICQWYH